MKRKQGISLIVLVITIIVMIILAAAVIISLNNAGIIGKSSDAVTQSDLKIIQQESEIVKAIEIGAYYADTYREAKLTKFKLLDKLNEHFKGSTKSGDRIITSDGKYVIIVGDDLSINVGVNVEGKNNEVSLTITYDSPVAELPYNVHVTPVIEGWEKKDEDTGETYASYEEYVNAILPENVSDNELKAMFIEGTNYWNVANLYCEPIYDNINQLISTWSMMYDENAYTTLEGMLECYEVGTLRELAINFQAIKPEGYFGDDYISYAKKELQSTTKTYEQLYMEGVLGRAKYEDTTLYNNLKGITNFSEFVEVSLGYENINNMTELTAHFNDFYKIDYMTEEKMLIMLKAVETEQYYTLKDMEDGEVAIKCSNGQTVTVMTSISAEFTIYHTNEITFEATAFNGSKAKETFKPEVDIKPLNYTALDTKYFDFDYDSTTMTATIKGIKDTYQEVGYYEHKSLATPYEYPKAIVDGGTKITDIVLPSKVVNPSDNKEYTITKVADYAFTVPSSVSGHTEASFTSLVLPETITTIGDYAFFSWSLATKVTIPKSVTSIGAHAFSYWYDLAKVYYTGTETEYSNMSIGAQWGQTGGLDNAFKMYNSQYTIVE